MEKKHIAMLIGSLNKGGSERVLVNLAEYFRLRGYKVTIVTQYKTENEYTLSGGIDRILSDITKEETGRSRTVNFLKRFFKLRHIWQEKEPDLILSFIGKNNMMAILTSRFLHIPTVVSVRGEPKEEYYSPLLKLSARLLFCFADGIVLQTAASMEFFPKTVRKKAIVLKNSLNPAFIRETYTGERDKEIVAVGRIDANKNHEMIIKAFAAIADKYKDYRLIIYGEGELRLPLLKMTEELGLEEQISLPGSISDVAETIYKASVFVLSSYSEGMPNTLIEAMALGIPCISTNCSGGGPAELIEENENGILVEPGDWKKMAENLQKLISDKEYAAKLGRNAAKIKDKLNPDIVNGAWEEYFSKMYR